MGDMAEDQSGGEQNEQQPWVMPREYEIGGVRWFSDTVHELQREIHPLLAQVKRVELADPPPRPALPAEGEAQPSESSSLYRPTAVQHEWRVSVEDVVGFDVDKFIADVYGVADKTGGQMVRAFLELVSDVSEEYGNVVDGAGRDFFDVFAESLETIDITFDDNGRPNLTVVMHPDEMDKLRGKKPTPEQEARLNAILERRWEEWRAARRRRDLP